MPPGATNAIAEEMASQNQAPTPGPPIPWSEIFKHHISLCEGHLRMVDSVRKHTETGSNNHQLITSCMKRAEQLLSDAKHVQRTFVIPKEHRNGVAPSSSLAFPQLNHTPAGQDFKSTVNGDEQRASGSTRQGQNMKYPETEQEIGQAMDVIRTALAAVKEAKLAQGTKSRIIRKANVAKRGQSGFGPSSEFDPASKVGRETVVATNGTSPHTQPPPKGDNPYFVVDTKPTPVNIPGMIQSGTKREMSSPIEVANSKNPKKAKKHHEGDMPRVEQGIEFEDISGEVNARLKEKDEKRKQKEVKKRKRGSNDRNSTNAATITGASGATTLTENPKQKKQKAAEDTRLLDQVKLKREREPDSVPAANVATAADTSKPATNAEDPKQKKQKRSEDKGIAGRNASKRKRATKDGTAIAANINEPSTKAGTPKQEIQKDSEDKGLADRKGSKRKRDSNGDTAANVSTVTDPTVDMTSAEKPRKKKRKGLDEAKLADATVLTKKGKSDDNPATNATTADHLKEGLTRAEKTKNDQHSVDEALANGAPPTKRTSPEGTGVEAGAGKNKKRSKKSTSSHKES